MGSGAGRDNGDDRGGGLDEEEAANFLKVFEMSEDHDSFPTRVAWELQSEFWPQPAAEVTVCCRETRMVRSSRCSGRCCWGLLLSLSHLCYNNPYFPLVEAPVRSPCSFDDTEWGRAHPPRFSARSKDSTFWNPCQYRMTTKSPDRTPTILPSNFKQTSTEGIFYRTTKIATVRDVGTPTWCPHQHAKHP